MKFFKTICALLILLLPLLVFQNGFAQSSFSITPSATNFTIGSNTGLSTSLTNASAFTLHINSNNSNFNLSTSVTSKSFNPSGVAFSGIPFTVALSSSGKSPGFTSSIQLVESPASAPLATGAKTNKNGSSYNYDLVLNPIGYTIPPGNYIFTVTIIYTDNNSTIPVAFNISLNVQGVMSLSLNQNVSTAIDFSTSSAYVNGLTFANFHGIQVASNMLWQISVAANSPYFFSGSAGASANMPCSVMKIKASDVSTYLPLSTSATTIKTGSRGDATALGNSPTFDVNFNPGYDYNPGVYNLSLTYTLTSQ